MTWLNKYENGNTLNLMQSDKLSESTDQENALPIQQIADLFLNIDSPDEASYLFGLLEEAGLDKLTVLSALKDYAQQSQDSDLLDFVEQEYENMDNSATVLQRQGGAFSYLKSLRQGGYSEPSEETQEEHLRKKMKNASPLNALKKDKKGNVIPDCPCKLARRGSKLVQIDCNGNIVK